ncbi:MAG: hypothetical protein ABI306_05905 [Caulobacteraceae bacterium]
MGYQGKSSAATAGAIATVYGAYFLWTLQPNLSVANVMAHIVGTVVLLAVIAAVLEIFIYVSERRAKAAGRLADERDALNAARSARNGYYALLSLVWIVPPAVLLPIPAMFAANCILGMIVFAEIVHYASRAFYDSRGA